MSEDKNSITVERSKTLARTRKSIDIVGLEDLDTSIIPVPFYRIAYPEKVKLQSGEYAPAGTIYMADTGEAVEKIEFALLRAKRRVVEFTNSSQPSVRIGLLGMNLTRFTPFILSISPTSFSNLGRLINQLRERKAKSSWEYKVIMTTERTKNADGQVYWVANFLLEDKKLDKETKALLDDAFPEFAASLDRQNETEPEEDEQRPF